MSISKKLLLLLPLVYVVLVYKPFIFEGKLPIPSDVIVGVYHPWRDFYHDQYPNGIPFKNALVTDSIRQLYPWRKLVIEQLKRGEWPLWNPYSFSGYPLMANVQSAPFYPLNILYWILEFDLAWSVQVMGQSILGFIFMALYLRSLRLRGEAVILGAVAWAGCGFFVSWLTSNTVVQAAIWIPMIFWSTELILLTKKVWRATGVLIFSLCATLLSGHLQTSFYTLAVFLMYAAHRTWKTKDYAKSAFFAVGTGIFIVITSFFWLPALEFIGFSAREVDQANWQKADWFIPWQNLAQFIAPDFFGNPATLNYFGVWNYAEFVGYLGIIPLLFAFLAIFSRHAQKGILLFFLVLALIFALPTPLAKIPFQLDLPLISSSQPSRLMVVVDFSLASLAAIGFDWFLQSTVKRKFIFGTILLGNFLLLTLWVIALNLNLVVSMRNLYLPTAILLTSSVFILAATIVPKFRIPLAIILVLIVALDLSRFASKFVPFSNSEWLFPKTAAIEFLQSQSKSGVFRIGVEDDRILPANFSAVYKLQAISGYDPLYLRRYAEAAAAIGRNRPDIEPPFEFNRVISPRIHWSPLYRLLGVKYYLSIHEIKEPNVDLVFQEGETRVYEDDKVIPRAFFVSRIVSVGTRDQALGKLLNRDFNPALEAVVEGPVADLDTVSLGEAKVVRYLENEVSVETTNSAAGLLVLTDIYYPGWKATIDGRETAIYLTDYLFRGVAVPAGKHVVKFNNSFSWRLPGLSL